MELDLSLQRQVRQHLDRAIGDRGQLAVLQLRLAAPREIEELANDRGHARRLLGDHTRAVAILVARPLGGRDHLGVTGDDVERRAQLVGQARRQLPDGG